MTTKDPTLRQEIDELRAEIKRLAAERKVEERTKPGATSEPCSNEAPLEVVASEEPGAHDLLRQARELLEVLAQDLRGAKPVALLTAFLLGLLLGHSRAKKGKNL